MMRYVSTRGTAPVLDFQAVMLAGLARDGGLYVPESWPVLTADDVRAAARAPYADTALRVMAPFMAGAFAQADLRRMVEASYGTFSHQSVAPLTQIGANEWLMELYHGPTLAFKDVALQLLGRLFEDVLSRTAQRATIVGATSGDTGSAAIEAFRGRAGVDIFILHPKGRVSEVQRRQMTTVMDGNVHNLAVEGTFDDCQALVKAMFNDHAFRDRMALSGVNSINWARILAQTVYYITAAAALGAPDRAVDFSVPTGNFGDVYAGYAAKAMGVPLGKLVVATNINDILARTLATGRYEVGGVVPTQSPSMDIQVSSNFERFLFDANGRDGAVVAGQMAGLAQSGAFGLSDQALALARRHFAGQTADEETTLATIRDVYRQTGLVIDPHTAVGIAAGRREKGDAPMVYLATAHPAKFPDAVERALSLRPALPARLQDLFTRPERFDVLPNDLKAIESHIAARASIAAGAA